MSQQNHIQNAIESAYSLYEHKNYHECIDLCIQILSIDYARAEVWNLAGLVLLELQNPIHAISYLTQAHDLCPHEISYALNLAESHRRALNPAKCVEILTQFLAANAKANDNPTLHFNLAKAYSDLEDSIQSVWHYGIAIKLDPNDLGAMFNLANAKVNLKQFGEAIELYINALQRGYLDAGVNLANTYTQIGFFSEALSVYEALYTHYCDDADFLFNYANALNYARANAQHTQALYQRAIALDPHKVQYCINYAHFLLKSLHFQAGFQIYEERKKLPNMLPQGITKLWNYDKHWNAEDFVGKNVLIYHEQGLGDSIMFARFLPLVKAKAKSVQLIIQEPLIELFTYLGYTCVSSNGYLDIQQEKRTYDIAISLLSLPLALGITQADEIACDTSTQSLFALNKTLEQNIQDKRKSQSLKVGICFSTDSKFPEAQSKNIPLALLLNALQDCQVYSLNKATQGRLGEYKLREAPQNMTESGIQGIIEPRLDHFMDTAQVIAELDIVVSIDSAVAHLSASMGKPTIVLLHKRYDWRWGNGVSTPWYEHVRAITQSKMDEWSDVVQNLKICLQSHKNLKATW